MSVAGHGRGWLVLSARLRLEARLWFKNIKVAFEFDPSRSSQIPESPVNVRIFTFLSIQSSIIFFFTCFEKKKFSSHFHGAKKKDLSFRIKTKMDRGPCTKKIMCFFVSDIYLVVQLIGKKKIKLCSRELERTPIQGDDTAIADYILSYISWHKTNWFVYLPLRLIDGSKYIFRRREKKEEMTNG